MRVLVTDLTFMTQTTCCVAGWSLGEGRMVRPLPESHHWEVNLIDRHGIQPGIVFACKRSTVAHSSDFPHRTEDVRIVRDTIAVVESRAEWWRGDTPLPIADSLNAAFDGRVLHTNVWHGERKGLYVPKGSRVSSLGAIQILRDALRFEQDDGFGKVRLRGSLNDGKHAYNLVVTSLALHRIHAAGGVNAVNASLPPAGMLHVRVGLARAWKEQPDKCALMINGIAG